MTAQCYAETDFPIREEEEPFPASYLEALEDHRALAANLLNLAINGETIKRCWDCSSWAGRCLKGKLNQIARSEACDQFSQRAKKR
jgi:hypothetical protein